MATTVTSRNIIDQIKQLNYNPAEIHRVILQGIQKNSNGEVTIYDPSTPMMASIEAGILTPVSVLQEIGAITRTLYKSAVDNWDDLYIHLQDKDLEDLTAQPSVATIYLFMSIQELRQKAVLESTNSGVKILQIPRHTQIIVGDYTLMLKYPVTIRINSFGNFSIKYDVSVGETIGSVTNALINHNFVTFDGIDCITFPLETVQVAMSSNTYPVSQSSGFKQKIKINDNFFMIKAYTRFSSTSNWIEIDTTRRLKVLNKNKATIQYIEGTNQLTILTPSYYLINGMIGTEIRLDIYTTKGNVTHSLVNYGESSYKLNYLDYNNPSNVYAGILGNLALLKIYSDDIMTGGRDRLSFDVVKNRAINRSSISEGVPITELEINNKLSDLGFSNALVEDLVLSTRKYAASRLITAPSSGLTVTGLGCNVQTHQTTIKDLTLLPTVKDNGARVTVLPTTLYNVVNGVLKVVDPAIVQQMINPAITSPEAVAAWANENNLLYSPYYYVHDTSNNEYNVTPYRLDKPQVLSKSTINENSTLLLDASVSQYQLGLNSDLSGYALLVGLTVGSNFKEIDLANISLQISYTDDSGENRYYLNGYLVTPIDANTGRPIADNYIYRFDLKTNWDINSSDQLILSDSYIPVPLISDMDVFIIIRGFKPTGFTKTTMDSLINIYSLANYDGVSTQAALIQERLNVKLGTRMTNLWQNARTTISEADYKRYTENIPATYTDNVYQRDANGVIEFQYSQDTGGLIPIILHAKGDPVVIDSVPVYAHKINDIVMENGEPVYINGLRGLKRQIDLVMFDGLYYLSTHQATIQYITEVLDMIDDWVFNYLRDQVVGELIDRTNVYFHPKATVGLIDLYVENGIKVTANSAQTLNVRLFVNDNIYNNTDLRTNLAAITKQVIQAYFENNSTISDSDIVATIKDNLGDNVLGIELKGFMNDLYSTVSVVDNLTTPSIGKRLAVNSKLELVVEDAVDVEFIWHTKRDS